MNRTEIAVTVCLATLAAVFAEESPPTSFTTTANLGLTLTDGNSETLQANASLVTEGEKANVGSVRAGVEANYGESSVDGNKETTVKNGRAFLNVKKTLSPHTFGSLNVSALDDDIAKIDYRVALAPGLGAFLVKNDRLSLSIEAGPAYIWEKVADVEDDYWAFRFAERLTYALSKTAKAWQSAEYIPVADDFDDYLLNTELGVEAAMTTRVNLRVLLQNKHDSTPGPDMKKDDLSLIAGVGIKL